MNGFAAPTAAKASSDKGYGRCVSRREAKRRTQQHRTVRTLKVVSGLSGPQELLGSSSNHLSSRRHFRPFVLDGHSGSLSFRCLWPPSTAKISQFLRKIPNPLFSSIKHSFQLSFNSPPLILLGERGKKQTNNNSWLLDFQNGLSRGSCFPLSPGVPRNARTLQFFTVRGVVNRNLCERFQRGPKFNLPVILRGPQVSTNEAVLPPPPNSHSFFFSPFPTPGFPVLQSKAAASSGKTLRRSSLQLGTPCGFVLALFRIHPPPRPK